MKADDFSTFSFSVFAFDLFVVGNNSTSCAPEQLQLVAGFAGGRVRYIHT